MRVRTFAGLVLALFAPPALAGDPAPSPKHTVKVFEVSDLVWPLPGVGEVRAAKLIHQLTSHVHPYSWEGAGGTGQIEYFDLGCSLLVKNRPEVVGEVAALIESMRRFGGDPATFTKRLASGVMASAVSVPVAAGPECPGAACPPHTSALDRLRKLAAAHADAPGRASYAVKLRNVAAADVAHAMHKRFGDALVVAADPMRNVLVASGDPEQVRRALDLASELDVAPPQVVVSGLVLEVKREFLSTAGLVRDTDAAPATAWTLSARETHMLMQLVRHEKATGDINFLSRPTVQVADNHTGIVRATQELVLANYNEIKVAENKLIEKPVSVSVGLSMKVTPRVLPCGETVALRVETEYTKPAPGLGLQLADGKTIPGLACQQLQATATLKRGESCVLTGYTDKDTVTLVILTPAAPPKPAAGPGWFLR